MSNKKMSDVFDLPLWVGDSDEIRDDGGCFLHEDGFSFSDDPKAIVHAVNNHDKLVGLLEEAYVILKGCRYSEMPMAKKIKSSLQAIKGE